MDETFGITVDPNEWQRMKEEQRAAYIQNMAEERTAKTIAKRLEDGSFMIQADGVSRCSLFLPQNWMNEKGKVEVIVNGKSNTMKAKASKKVLLEDFVERFDRTFLPVAELQIKKL